MAYETVTVWFSARRQRESEQHVLRPVLPSVTETSATEIAGRSSSVTRTAPRPYPPIVAWEGFESAIEERLVGLGGDVAPHGHRDDLRRLAGTEHQGAPEVAT